MFSYPTIIIILVLVIIGLLYKLALTLIDRDYALSENKRLNEVNMANLKDVQGMSQAWAATRRDFERYKHDAERVKDGLMTDLRRLRQTNNKLSHELEVMKQTPAKPKWPHSPSI